MGWGTQTPAQREIQRARAEALEQGFATQIRMLGLPAPERQFLFAAPRKWRFDFAWPEQLVAVEVDGATWSGGRHTRGSGYESDCHKLNAAAGLGWRVLHVTSGMIDDASGVDELAAALAWRRYCNAACQEAGDPHDSQTGRSASRSWSARSASAPRNQ